MSRGLAIAAVILAWAAYTVGFERGQRDHDGKVLVPAEQGVPADLPEWAEGEIVMQRMQQLDLQTRADRAAMEADSFAEALAYRCRRAGVLTTTVSGRRVGWMMLRVGVRHALDGRRMADVTGVKAARQVRRCMGWRR
jgi:hypothetical protein